NWSPLRGSMNYTQSVYVNTPIRAYESAAGAAHEIPPGGGAKAALCAAWLWRTLQSRIPISRAGGDFIQNVADISRYLQNLRGS
ncbi:MAG: hypothetical protein IJB89_04520, partial [Akkermansia sp.]|nr:hypothetical protein [Akkermansia sp.]